MTTQLAKKDAIPAISTGPFTATPIGLVPPKANIPYEIWKAYGQGLQRVEGALQFVIGDWLNYGEHEYGEKYSQALENTEWKYQRLADYAYVAQNIDFSLRNEKLDFWHHREVAKLLPNEQAKWLDLAEENTWSVRELRAAIRQDGKQPAAPVDFIDTVIEGDNSKALPPILQLYLPDGGYIADPTFGEGVFWLEVDSEKYQLEASDIEDRPGVNRTADFRKLPYEDETFDAVVFDPPYKLTGTPEDVDRYRNLPGGYKAVPDMYRMGMKEAHRILKSGGVLIVKCMDQVVSGKQDWYHRRVYEIAQKMKMLAEDLFVLIRPSATPQPHQRQLHARKRHSFFWVFRKV